ncbi:chlorite dismutase family protein [Nitrospira sp. Kam-Ns4a]
MGTRMRALIVGACLVAFALSGASPLRAAGPIDRAKILTDTGVYGTYALFRIDPEWYRLDRASRDRGVAEAKAVLARHADTVLVETYLVRGLLENADFLLRLHAYELARNQELLVDLMATEFGHYLRNTQTLNGLTKPLNYLPKLEDLSAKMKAALTDAGPMPYAIVVPIKKDAAWWLSSEESRLEMMKEHTEATLGYLKTVRRKLYHSTGLDDWDFVTYFETAKLEDFHNLVLNLKRVRENRHNERVGHPTILGTARGVDALFDALR